MKDMTRRQFVGHSLASVGAVGAAAAGLSCSQAVRPAPGQRVLGANDRIRFAVIGCGGQGRVDMKTFFKASKNVECPLVCDVDDEQLSTRFTRWSSSVRPGRRRSRTGARWSSARTST